MNRFEVIALSQSEKSPMSLEQVRMQYTAHYQRTWWHQGVNTIMVPSQITNELKKTQIGYLYTAAVQRYSPAARSVSRASEIILKHNECMLMKFLPWIDTILSIVDTNFYNFLMSSSFFIEAWPRSRTFGPTLVFISSCEAAYNSI